MFLISKFTHIKRFFMRNKLFSRLKQEYSHLGLGDSVLQAHAEALNAMGLVTEDNLDIVISSQKTFLENLQKENDKRASDAYNKAKNAKEDGTKNDADVPEWYKTEKAKNDKLIKSLQDTIDSLNEKNENYEKEKLATARINLIRSKAKELGIPQFRIEEGFAIADDADDNTITSYLTTVANNIKTQLLPGNKTVFPHAGDKVEKSDADTIAESLIS